MVPSVVAVVGVGKVKRDQQNSSYSDTANRNSGGSFAQVLEKVTDEKRDASLNCHTTTYGRDSMIRTFYYQSRAYRF